MEAASKDAKDPDGFFVGIIPHNEKSYAPAYCDVVIPTGLGYARDFITAYSADAVIVVGVELEQLSIFTIPHESDQKHFL